MSLNLSDTYSLCVTIFFWIEWCLHPFKLPKRGENNGDNCALAGDILSKYLSDIDDC